MNKLMIAVATTALLSTSAFAGDAAAGKSKAATCAACHGADGIAAIPMYPNLAGQKEAYLVKQLKDFKAGTRKDPVMAGMAAPLSDTDIADLAAYYSSLK
ncbi:cytochrome c [Colwellia sp. D2M02]|uniref:Cytochrome c domain-containing protein n=1 Tax=Colwellia asteriadis TaxID=517723 RepID=A0ABN1LBJ0_9GAMM|nr:cytochrome c [Colwellia sp. D2M02]MBU2895010.1 cytochrome c [Colwellia sp. D2M02]